MMNKYYFLIGLVVALSACTTSPSTYTDFDRSHSFGNYKLFSWAHQPPLVSAGDLPISGEVESKATEAIKRNLESRGFKFVEDSSLAHFLITYTVGARESVDIYQEESSVYHNKENWLWGKEYHSYYFDRVLPEEFTSGYTRGVISIDIFDNRSRQPVWHGKASKPLTPTEIASKGGSIEKAVDLILTRFPPKN